MAQHASNFVHLHLHSEYSLLDGANRIDKLIDRVKALGMPAVAVTDHGNLHGAIQFYTKAKAAGIKPILGIEAYIAPDINGRPSDRTDKTYTGISDGGFHLVLLAENNTGWANLLKLSSDSFIHGFYYKPRMDKSTLAQWSDGVIAINGHLSSSLAYHLTNFLKTHDPAHWTLAVNEAQWHAKTFGPDRFYIELQRHVPETEALNPLLVKLARELNLPLVADNDAHFLLADDHDAHDSLICISTGKTKDDPARMKYPPELFVKSPDQMAQLFTGYLDGAGDEALANTLSIADRCNVEIDFKTSHTPVVKIVHRTTLPSETDVSARGASPHGLASSRQPNSAAVRSFTCEHPPGSTDWFKAICSQYQLHPYDTHTDHDSRDQIKQQCDTALRALAEAGAIWRYGPGGVTDQIRARLDRELAVLADKNISAYFLIVWDFVNFARARGIPANARGSALGTMVGYCLGLSNACPVHYGLLFERFTDPDRSEYPDIDIDICQDGRAAVIDYVRNKYGHVAQIITFGTLKARAALRDVGRVLNIPLAEVDRIAKLVPNQLNITLDEALAAEPNLKKEYDSSDATRRLIDTARKLEGVARHASVHAAGVVVATQPLDHIVPLYKAPNAADVITQWDGPTCEKVGLLKMDFLGLRTLSIIQRAKDLITDTLDRQTQLRAITGHFGAGPVPDSPREFGLSSFSSPSGGGREGAPHATAHDEASGASPEPRTPNPEPSVDPLDLDRLTYLDANVLDLFRRGETKGIFQFESSGMRDLLMSMKPDRLEDLIAANALFRPGPMDLIPEYTNRKLGRAPVPRFHEIVDRFTAETYGVMVYQEQVMQIVHELGDIPLRAAYTLIKNISKKNKRAIDAARPKFIEGASAKGLAHAHAQQLFELVLKFAGYGFNKSHSTGYAIIAYQTGYLKTYFPVQYMAALLTYESVSTDKVVEYIDECRRVRLPDGRVGIDVRPPDINHSFTDFTVVYDPDEPRDPNHGHIRFGLGAVKGVGNKAVDAVIKARNEAGPFKSLFDFCERISTSSVSKACIEALIKCGAFDSLHGSDKRAAMLAALDAAVSRGAQEADLRNADDFLFGSVSSPPAPGSAGGSAPEPRTLSPEPSLPPLAAWDRHVQLDHEKKVLGFYVSAHPLDQHRATIDRFSNAAVRDVRQLPAETEVTLGGMFTRIRTFIPKSGGRNRNGGDNRMAFVTFEDRTGSIDGVVFSDTLATFSQLIQPDSLAFIKGKVDHRREEPSIRVEQVIPVEQAPQTLTTALRIILSDCASKAQGLPSLGVPRVPLSSPSDSHHTHTTLGVPPVPHSSPSGGGWEGVPQSAAHDNASSSTSAIPFNGSLQQLRNLLRTLPAGRARVYLEIHEQDKIVILSTGFHIQPTDDLPARIATLLQSPNSCHLLGPTKLAIPTALPTTSGPPRLTPQFTLDDELAESLD